MALVDPNIAMGFKQPNFQPTNALAQYAQISQIQGAQQQREMSQMQIDKLRRDADIFKQFQEAVVKHGGPSDPDSIVKALLESPDPANARLGYEMNLKNDSRKAFDKLLVQWGYTPSPTGATSVAPGAGDPFASAPEASPGTPVPPRVMPQGNALTPAGSGIPENRMWNAAPMDAGQTAQFQQRAAAGDPEAQALLQTYQQRPANAMAAPTLSGQEIQNRMVALSGSADPRATSLIRVLQPQLAEAIKVSTGSPGSSIIRGGEVVGKIPEAPAQLKKDYEAYKAMGGTKSLDEFRAPGGQSEFGKLADKARLEEATTSRDAAITATDSVAKLSEVIQHLKSSDAITGIGAGILLNVERLKSQFLEDKKAGKVVADTQYLDAALGSDVFPMIQSLNIGARGMDTPAEREYIRGVMTGTIEMNQDTLIRLTEIRAAIATRAIKRYNEKVESGQLDDYFTAMKIPKAKIPMPEFNPTAPTRSVVRTGTANNRKVIEYSDGSIEYAN